MLDLVLPSRYQRRRSAKVRPDRFRGFAKHIPCGGAAFWFTRFGKAWFDLNSSEIFFEDGQIKLLNRPIEEYRCPHCRQSLEGKALRLIKIIQDDEADAIHAQAHRKVPVGQVCSLCGDRKKGSA